MERTENILVSYEFNLRYEHLRFRNASRVIWRHFNQYNLISDKFGVYTDRYEMENKRKVFGTKLSQI